MEKTISTRFQTGLDAAYETYDFEVKTWEELDRDTFTVKIDAASLGSTQTAIETYLSSKIKCYSYLNFFSATRLVGGLRPKYEEVYRREMERLSAADLSVQATDIPGYEVDFTRKLRQKSPDAHAFYKFFTGHLLFFDHIAKGFAIKLGNSILVEDDPYTDTTKGKQGDGSQPYAPPKRIVLKNQGESVHDSKVIRCFPLVRLDCEPGCVNIKMIAFLGGRERSSIDFVSTSSQSEVRRIYLPEFKIPDRLFEVSAGSEAKPVMEEWFDLLMATLEAEYEAITFYTSPEEVVSQARYHRPSVFFDPNKDCKTEQVKICVVSGSDQRMRGVSIY